MMWPLSFISENDFIEHVKKTILKYGEKLEPYDLVKFNKNIIDPIKLIFDKTVYSSSWEDIIKNEIFRQRDKSNNNDIGYFHQNFFSYVTGCVVPTNGWDVIIHKEDGIQLPDGDVVNTIYVEMKNKHNTMNSASSSKTYMKMQSQILSNDDCACFLVEVVAKRSQNIKWEASIDGVKSKHKLIRKVSIDQFYALVTGIEDAFYQMCMVLPTIIKRVVENQASTLIPKDTAMQKLNENASIQQLEDRDISLAMAVYILGFNSYLGFIDR